MPSLPGCWSQVKTEAKAIANRREAIREHFVVRDDLRRDVQVHDFKAARARAAHSGVNHLDVVCALGKVGFHIARLRKHVVMPDGQRIVTTPRHNPVNAFTM